MIHIGIAADPGGFELIVQLTATLNAAARATRFRTGSRQNGRFGKKAPTSKQTAEKKGLSTSYECRL